MLQALRQSALQLHIAKMGGIDACLQVIWRIVFHLRSFCLPQLLPEMEKAKG